MRSESLTQSLGADIIRQNTRANMALPSERDLGESFGLSRATVRQGLKELEAMNLLHTRPGSGARVVERSLWQFSVLPLVFSTSDYLSPEFYQILSDVLQLRRHLISSLIKDLKAQPLEVKRAREAAEAAWQCRDNLYQFALHDADYMRQLMVAAERWVIVWLFNSLATVYLESLKAIQIPIRAPEDYLTSYQQFADYLAAGQMAQAHDFIDKYLTRLDQGILGLLKVAS